MKGKEIIHHITETEMPDMAQIRQNCLGQTTAKPKIIPKRAFLSGAAACIVFALIMAIIFQPTGNAAVFALSITTPNDNTVFMEDNADQFGQVASSVSYVDNGPQLRFFIDGEDIAKIEITSENEFVSARDWTESLAERYWNPELYYQEMEIDGVMYQYVPAESRYEDSIVLDFPENFTEYDQIWYDWYGWNLREWASQDNFAHIQGYNELSNEELEKFLETASEEDKLAIAAGGGGTSAAGHISLEGYPAEKLKDRITITITDRQGNKITQVIAVQISNNAFGQTVVTASLVD